VCLKWGNSQQAEADANTCEQKQSAIDRIKIWDVQKIS